MPQEVSTNQIAVKSLEGKPDQPWSMDANANRLMDDVFADVERILETGSETPTVPEEPAEYASFQKMGIPSVTIPAEIASRPKVTEQSAKPAKIQKRQQSGKSLEQWLLIAACASLGITLLLWVLGQGRLNSLFGNNSTSTTKATQATQKDLAFVDYMQRSLDSIDRKAENRQQVPVVPPAPPPTQPPLPVLNPGNLPQNSSRPNVLERVYIPVYPQPRIIYTNPAAPAAKPSPQAAAPSPANSTAKASPTPAAKPKPEAKEANRPVAKAPTVPKLSAALPTQTASPTTKPTTAASSTPTTKPTTVAEKPAASRNQTTTESPRVAAIPSTPAQPTFRNRSTQATAPTSGNQYSLRGVLVLGDRSAAIFEVGGVSRRIYVGESIGSSGWTLVEINNENSEAVIRKNGEVRSIFVGQQF
ncbi:hypothetical protein NIES2119_14975 [[Phormidium ambiguum] IAM M-71]|uniref:Type II secretion system protein GspC N-terminal domain-containing protein n=2 Tax=[Phormidium ambiguum] IAM M-71 TaxID=454136 RepID=A0A1U7IIX0_9CYAN|nr:hypothetical protein NIES2119_14975 [Phormidium ambiguum IAM M-71]